MGLLNFYGRIVIVTGAGRGIGRAYAKEFAKRGATVIVNDSDKRSDDTTSFMAPAEQVVSEICESGGKAIANYDSVENGEEVVQKTVSEFGRVDVIVNNAGLLHDKSFKNLSAHEWDAVHKVHLKGAFSLSKAAWPHFNSRKFGRLIFVSSNSGLYGNFGQTNYAAAKCGLLGFSKTLALEGRKHNIHSNVIVPTAVSRMTSKLFPKEFLNMMKPELVAPMVVYLSHESCKETGKVYEAAGSWFGQVQFYRSRGKYLRHATAETVRDHINEIQDMTHARHFESLQDVFQQLMHATSENENIQHSNEIAEPGMDFEKEKIRLEL